VGSIQETDGLGYVEKATQYARDVVSGAVPACSFVRYACQRQLDDLARPTSPDWPYRFDVKRAEDPCWFIEQLKHIKGAKAGKRLILEPWQHFILTTVFGWVYDEDVYQDEILIAKAGTRRFRKGYAEIPKGNGKSPFSAGIALYMLAADGELGAEVYSAATTRDQAKYVFEPAQHMARKCKELKEQFGVEVHAHDIAVPDAASWFKTFSSDENSAEGANPHCIVVDELHAHPNRKLYDNLETACGKRDQDLFWLITTAGSDRTGICYEVRSYLIKILTGVVKDERVFGIIYTIDENDDWMDPAIWRKANPNWGVSVQPTSIAQKAKEASQMASKQAAFLTKHLNIWVNADTSWMNMRLWDKCADPKMNIESLKQLDSVLGLDLASKNDLLACVLVFWQDLGDVESKQTKRHYYVFGRYWVPEDTVEQSTNSQYSGWVRSGKLQTCWGATNDFDEVEKYIRECCKKYKVKEIAHDPYQAVEIVNHLSQDQLLMVKIDQNAKNLSGPMDEFTAAVLDGRFHFDGDPVLTWAVSNVVAHRDKNDNLFPNKERYENKIDPVTAILTAMNRVMVLASTPQPKFEIFSL
jgi:phage terminase large subunit-like protein